MNLLAAITTNLDGGLLTKLAQAAAARPAAVQQLYAQAVPLMMQRLALPRSPSDVNAQWDICRQLFLSGALTNEAELLRTDTGWPARRVYLAQSLLGEEQFTALTQQAGNELPGPDLLGYLTVLVLAMVGRQASENDLEPAALGDWLQQQEALSAASVAAPLAPISPLARTAAPATILPVAASSQATPPAAAPRPVSAAATAAPSSRKKLLPVVGAAVMAAIVGGYFLLGTPASANQQNTVAAAPPTEATPATGTAPAAAPAATTEAAPVAAASTKSATPTKPEHHAPASEVLADTVGNATVATQIGGNFDSSQGRYPKGEGQPVNIKLISHTTLTVGINSSESLLYKHLVNPGLSRPSTLPLDRLTFEPGKAKLPAEGAQQLGNVVSLLKTFPKAHLLVLGHATTTEAEAMHLSLERANAARDELVKQGISASRLEAQGVLVTGTPVATTAAEKLALRQGISLSISRL